MKDINTLILSSLSRNVFILLFFSKLYSQFKRIKIIIFLMGVLFIFSIIRDIYIYIYIYIYMCVCVCVSVSVSVCECVSMYLIIILLLASFSHQH